MKYSWDKVSEAMNAIHYTGINAVYDAVNAKEPLENYVENPTPEHYIVYEDAIEEMKKHPGKEIYLPTELWDMYPDPEREAYLDSLFDEEFEQIAKDLGMAIH